jgi:translation elongation factor P/translation initiation factor 5A
MIELLKYLANNLKPEQLLEVADILSRNPEMIDQEAFIQMVNEVEHYEMHEIDKSQYDELKKRMEEIDEIRYNSTLYKLLKDNDISLN